MKNKLLPVVSVFFLSLILSLPTFADTLEVADEFYQNRGEDIENALNAANIYKSFANAAKNNDEPLERMRLIINETKALYYYGDNHRTLSRDEKEDLYMRGMQSLDFITKDYFLGLDVNSLSREEVENYINSLTEEELDLFARGMYNHAIILAVGCRS